MRRINKCLAAVALCLAPAVARADFVISHTLSAGSGTLAGYDVLRFYARNTQSGQHPTTTTLTGFDVSVQVTGGAPLLDFRDLNADGKIDANLGGVGLNSTTPTASFLKIGSDGDQLGDVIGVPTRVLASATNDPVGYYTGRSQFEAAWVNLVGHRPDARTGAGALFAVIVVPNTATSVSLTGEIADELGISGSAASPLAAADARATDFMAPPIGAAAAAPPDSFPPDAAAFGTPGWFQVAYAAPVPEPTAALGVLGVLTLGAVTRRRRRN